MPDVIWLCSRIVERASNAYKASGSLTVLDVNEGKDETVVTLGIKELEMPLVSISVKEVPYEVGSGLMDLSDHVMLAC